VIESPDPLNASLAQDTNASGRKAYHTPTLQRYGDIQELTLTSSLLVPPFNPDGGALFPIFMPPEGTRHPRHLCRSRVTSTGELRPAPYTSKRSFRR
jgi:hypothetical protein